MTLDDWVWEANVRRFAEWVARWTDYTFDDSDWQAIETALPHTDAWDENRWYEYPISGQPSLTLVFARDPDARPVSIRVLGEVDPILKARIETLFSLLQDVEPGD